MRAIERTSRFLNVITGAKTKQSSCWRPARVLLPQRYFWIIRYQGNRSRSFRDCHIRLRI